MADVILQTKALRKSFRVGKQQVVAVDGVDLTVYKGEVFGFLGPNGAGKSTTLRMLTTLLSIDSGEARIAGVDVRTAPHEVRKHVGYVSQLGGADDEATGRADLILQGSLYGLSRSTATKRATELVKALALEEFADRKISTYSGGQKRRLDVAMGIMHQPDILFLDEPTTGLDPQNRANLWTQIRKLRDEGTTIFLTTHYLEEADILSDRLAIMDRGKIVAVGTPRELKAKIAGDSIIIKPTPGHKTKDIQKVLATESFIREVKIEGDIIRLYVENGSTALPRVISLLEHSHIKLETVSLASPSLDDVFLQQTGRSLRDTGANGGMA